VTEDRVSQTKSSKVLVVGLDGGTFDLVRPWVRDGYLPTFKRLMEEGVSDDLCVELPPGTAANWPSFMTGKNPGKHGVIYWYTPDKDSWTWSMINSHSIKEKTLWEILQGHGKKPISINVPVTYPPGATGGTMITGLLTPPSAEDFTYPRGLKEEIASEVGRYKIYSDEIYREGREEKFLASLTETLDLRFRTSRYLMNRYEWDLFMIVFSETDAVQHAFWKFIDPKHPKYDEALARRFGRGILQIYEKIDQYLAEYLGSLEKGTTLMIMSDHGAGPFYKKFYTNNWLRGLGLLTLKKSPWSRFKYWAFRQGFTMQNVYRLVMKTGLANLRRKVDKNESTESLIRKCFLSYRDIDWKTTKAFAFGGFGQIYLNVKKKEEESAELHSGDDYEEVREQILRQLGEMELPGGGPFIERAFRKEELYSGPHMALLPDIIFKPNRGFLDPGDFEFFSNKIFDDGVGSSGSHQQNGLFLMWGDRVKTGEVLRGTRILDLAPTLLYLLGLPVSTDMDGRVLLDGLKEEWLGGHPVRYATPEEESSGDGRGYSSGEEEEIKKKLKGLGYLG